MNTSGECKAGVGVEGLTFGLPHPQGPADLEGSGLT